MRILLEMLIGVWVTEIVWLVVESLKFYWEEVRQKDE